MSRKKEPWPNRVDLSEMFDPTAGSLVPEMVRGMPLADFECAHGSLPADRPIRCDCWGPVFRPDVFLDRVRESVDGDEIGYTRGIEAQHAKEAA